MAIVDGFITTFETLRPENTYISFLENEVMKTCFNH